jgi:hypothetical protein
MTKGIFSYKTSAAPPSNASQHGSTGSQLDVVSVLKKVFEKDPYSTDNSGQQAQGYQNQTQAWQGNTPDYKENINFLQEKNAQDLNTQQQAANAAGTAAGVRQVFTQQGATQASNAANSDSARNNQAYQKLMGQSLTPGFLNAPNNPDTTRDLFDRSNADTANQRDADTRQREQFNQQLQLSDRNRYNSDLQAQSQNAMQVAADMRTQAFQGAQNEAERQARERLAGIQSNAQIASSLFGSFGGLKTSGYW